MMHQKSAAKNCPNCNTEYAGEAAVFCHHCGQARRDIQSPLRFWIFSFFESVLNYDSRLWRTLRTLLLRPGHISADFNEGRRVRYVEPFRLYLLISVAFFVIQGSLPESEGQSSVEVNRITRQGDTTRVHLNFVTTSFPTTNAEMMGVRNFNETQMDSFLRVKELPVNFATRMLMKGTSRLMSGEESFRQFEQAFAENVSRAMFFLVPVFAFLIWLLFRNRNPYYISHLVFALHFHSAVFLIFSLWFLPMFFFGKYGFDWLPLLACLIYLFLSLRATYREGRLVTGIKQFSATLVYLVVVLCGVTVAALVSIASF